MSEKEHKPTPSEPPKQKPPVEDRDREPEPEPDPYDETVEESFPASDPPPSSLRI